ncbi:MAG: protein NrnU, partial [Betaproteobacteria bacterium]|nr:protein NrnU [Betaproteobacteria bacterium]
MTWLIIGLILFLGAHSIRMVADDWRTQAIASWGEKPFKGVYSLLALVGFYAMVTGYAEARLQTVALWTPPIATRHVSVLLMLFASVLMAAAYVPRNHLKMRMGHPMVLSVKVWALAHLLANGNLADVVLFGSFLVWSVFNFKAARARDRAAAPEALRLQADGAENTSAVPGDQPIANTTATLLTVLIGVALWALFVF